MKKWKNEKRFFKLLSIRHYLVTFFYSILNFSGKQSKVNELGTEIDENSKKLADAIILKKNGNGVEAMKLLEQVPSDFESILLRYVLFEYFLFLLYFISKKILG